MFFQKAKHVKEHKVSTSIKTFHCFCLSNASIDPKHLIWHDSLGLGENYLVGFHRSKVWSSTALFWWICMKPNFKFSFWVLTWHGHISTVQWERERKHEWVKDGIWNVNIQTYWPIMMKDRAKTIVCLLQHWRLGWARCNANTPHPPKKEKKGRGGATGCWMIWWMPHKLTCQK